MILSGPNCNQKGQNMIQEFENELGNRLLKYAAIDSQSNEDSATTPSTEDQYSMLKLLEKELKDIKAQDIQITDYGVVLATIPGNKKGPTIGFLAHVDTAPQFNAKNVKPRLIKGYNGGDITFPDNASLILSPKDFPHLGEKQGHDIITASGKTLLGADDKAGIAIIMTAARHLMENPNIPRSKIRLAFNPDEEIARGVHKKLPQDLEVDFAFTFDGGKVGELNTETFSADLAEVTIRGVSIHPGEAKGEMVNAINLASRIINNLPQTIMTPEVTDGHNGFIHATNMAGGSSEMKLKFILRDFELQGLKDKGRLLSNICNTVQESEPRSRISCEIRPQYRNMRYWLDKNPKPIILAEHAIRNLGIELIRKPIRGGTDGSSLTEMGVPTPNLFTGMQNVHGPLEWISTKDMNIAANLLLKIASLAVET